MAWNAKTTVKYKLEHNLKQTTVKSQKKKGTKIMRTITKNAKKTPKKKRKKKIEQWITTVNDDYEQGNKRIRKHQIQNKSNFSVQFLVFQTMSIQYYYTMLFRKI